MKVKGRFSRLPAVLLALLGVTMTVYGASRGEVSVVLTKAIHICLECIGIG